MHICSHIDYIIAWIFVQRYTRLPETIAYIHIHISTHIFIHRLHDFLHASYTDYIISSCVYTHLPTSLWHTRFPPPPFFSFELFLSTNKDTHQTFLALQGIIFFKELFFPLALFVHEPSLLCNPPPSIPLRAIILEGPEKARMPRPLSDILKSQCPRTFPIQSHDREDFWEWLPE